MRANPFRLFRRQVEHATLMEYTASGLPNVTIAILDVITKRTTQSDAPSMEYESRITTRQFHIKPSTLPDEYLNDIETLLGLVIKQDNRAFMITDVSRGDDMTLGHVEFITVKATPYGRDSI